MAQSAPASRRAAGEQSAGGELADLLGGQRAGIKHELVDATGEKLGGDAARVVAVAAEDDGRRVGGEAAGERLARHLGTVDVEPGRGAVVDARQMSPGVPRDGVRAMGIL